MKPAFLSIALAMGCLTIDAAPADANQCGSSGRVGSRVVARVSAARAAFRSRTRAVLRKVARPFAGRFSRCG